MILQIVISKDLEVDISEPKKPPWSMSIEQSISDKLTRRYCSLPPKPLWLI